MIAVEERLKHSEFDRTTSTSDNSSTRTSVASHHDTHIMLSAPGLTVFAGLEKRDIIPRSGPIPDIRLEALASPAHVVRAASETTAAVTAAASAAGASQTCGPNDNTGFCQKYVGADTETLPIVLGVVIPLVGAFVVFLFLHRRHKKKLKKEDEDDAHKSLDFGLGENHSSGKPGKKGRGGKGAKNTPEMSSKDVLASGRRERGLSMDLDMTNPYLLPPGLESSRESLHSLSRTLNTGDDKYRAMGFIPNDGSQSYPSSLRSPMGDDGSSLTASSSRNQHLLRNANRLSGSQSRNQSTAAMDRKPLAPPKNNNLAAPGQDTARDSFMSTNSSVGPNAALRASNNYLAQFISGGFSDYKEIEKPEKQTSTPTQEVTPEEVEAPRVPEKVLTKDNSSKRRSFGQIYPPASPPKNEPISYHDAATVEQPEDPREPKLPLINISSSAPLSQDFGLPAIELNDHHYPQSPPDQQHQQFQQTDPTIESHDQYSDNVRPESNAIPNYDDRRETRQPTLPVVDLPHLAEHEHQHQQAQPAQEEEEEDYYDDYYDEEDEFGYDPHRLTNMGDRPLPPDDPSENPEQRANRIRSFYKEYFEESSNPGRRPSKPSRQEYYDGSENYAYDEYDVDQYYEDPGMYPPSRGGSRQAGFPGQGGRHRATFSAGSSNPGSRAYSSASGRYGAPGYGPPGRRGPPKKNLPPPKPLMTLPTPHMLKDDTFLTHMPIDFAPPGAFKGQRSGTPDSLRGEMKPYKAQRAHIPLASSYDDLAIMPSP
jgi:hypothetical protein